MTLLFLFVSSFAAITISFADNPCNRRYIQGESVVCVCNFTYCDDLVRDEPAKGTFITYTSSKDGLRFKKKVGFVQKSKTTLEDQDPESECREDLHHMTVELETRFQSIEGFGGAVTDSAGINWLKLTDDFLRAQLIESYFGSSGIEYTFIRTPIGGCDFSTRPYAFNELPENDTMLTNFTLAPEDFQYKIPMIQACMKAASAPVKVVATTWSPPRWMKTRDAWGGYSRLRPQYLQTYADYHLKFIEKYAEQGIPMWAITTTNEPMNGLVPLLKINSMGWTPGLMAKYIAEHLGPTIRNSSFNSTKILAVDDQRYTIPFWFNRAASDNPEVLKYVDGVGVHWYGDFLTPAAVLKEVYKKHPDKFLLGTEASAGYLPYDKSVILGSWRRAEDYVSNIIERIGEWSVAQPSYANRLSLIDSLTNDVCGPPAFRGLCGGLTALPRKNNIVKKPTKKNNRSDPNDDLWQSNLDLRLSTWNVLSLYRPGALYQTNKELQRYNIHIAALQEVRWPGHGECLLEGGSLFMYSGPDYGKHEYGTGFLVSKKAVGSVLKFVSVSEIICLLRIKSKFNNISILNAYAPTEQADDGAKDSFYEDLETAFDQIPDYDTKIVIGDFNAKVGREEAYQPTIGLFSKHPVSNDNGLRLISFASSKSMVIKSTIFPHKAIHLGTWKSHDGRTVNQIDHVLIDERHKSMVQDVRSYRGADCDSDHYLVGVKVKAKINATNFKQPIREPMINTDSLQDNTTCRAFNLELNNRFRELDKTVDIHMDWEQTKQIVKDVGIRVLGKKKRQKRKKWWNDNCETAIERKRKYKVLAEQDNRWEEKHREARRDFRRLVRRAKRDHLAGILKHMETLIRSNESRKFYQEVRTAKKAYQPATQLLEDEEGNLVSDPEKQKTMWRQYFQQLLNCPPVTNENPVNTEDCRVDHDPHKEPPDFEEVRRAIMRLKNHKSPGIDNIPGELWKYGGGAMQSRLYELIRRIWEEEQQPMEWNVGIICPIHKKGCRKKCGNYRGIALLPTAYKVLSYIILAGLEPYAEQILGDYQCGFRRNRSTVDQMFLLKQIMEKRWEYAQSVHCLFVDFAKAYDSIDRETLYHILTSYQVPKKLVRMIKIATGTSRMRVRAGGGLS
ncbi:unnamed protein product [Plutella xylostella]|uniref:Glucosylceramidase n=1 Tax=Plutella xylostella TaxID=51655 RepID=A0A8S4DV54_PLUXY|nr:unnamed protein product [Plutella xylostella]